MSKNDSSRPTFSAQIPMKSVGPICLKGSQINADVKVPLATFETPLWASTQRGADVTREAGGIQVYLSKSGMTRSILLTTSNSLIAHQAQQKVAADFPKLQALTQETSRFAQLTHYHAEVMGNLVFMRFTFDTQEASGHNMSTKAAEALLEWILQEHPALQYGSISGNFCTDKKVSAINGILGRGHAVTAEVEISAELCQKRLHVSPKALAQLCYQKNWVGSQLAGSLRSANAHFANMLLATYLATGQDAANIIEGSQGFTHAEDRGETLYFSVSLPNLIVGTVGNGKQLPFVQDNLEQLGCTTHNSVLPNSHRLAMIIAGTVLCGELSLLAAQANPGELMRSHLLLERHQSD